ncbi:putative helicase [Streptomyces africanus]|uniref:Helicase n=1 Tax=Streptomyces africanus TaxID=231024 RepID=A0ABU0QEF2_9ACTN|nr:putative helicase [Streptomyces africanus]MDQ0754007.1 putative helicase [Streptomyces africanus]
MDDEKIFGPVLYKLSLASAVSRGLLARYQIIVLELQDPVLTPERLYGEERYSEEVRGQRLGALRPRCCTRWRSMGFRRASPSTTGR